MTLPVSLTLQGVSHRLPDGRLLFSDLHGHFDASPTGLIGRNGIGKSVLARILAGALSPGSGRVLRSGRARYLPQQITPRPGQTVAALAGVQPVLDALRRIEGGSVDQRDFDLVGERWHLRSRFMQTLVDSGLSHLDADTPATWLSGGEITRVALAGAFVDDIDFLILDEPSNHLDGRNRQYLREQLHRWSGGLIVVSHDRALLDTMHGIVELSELGLRRYGGNYRFYAETRQHEREAAARQLEQVKAERKRAESDLADQRERLERRQSRGARGAANANLPPIVLGLRKSSSEVSSGKLRARQDAARAALSQRVREVAAGVEQDREIVVFAPPDGEPAPSTIAELDGVVLPYLAASTTPIDLHLKRGQRIGLVGANGSGKSTLLKLLCGQLEPASGRCAMFVDASCLDQHLSVLDPDVAVLDQLLEANPTVDESALRSRLALLGLDARAVAQAPFSLSGGERVRAALARVLYAHRPPQLLLLDEPDNHLDLASTAALESMLRQFTGTLVAVSHDPRFLAALKLTHRLEAGAQQWSLSMLGDDDHP
jgi:ATPase subunit of ABC transporter with duplicated ATPase domains